MSSRIIAFDPNQFKFVSNNGIEDDVTLTPEDNCEYYLIENFEYVVKLNKAWVSESGLLGEILSKSGKNVAVIPHPGKRHGKLSTGGLVSGDARGFKLIIEPFENSQSYYLYYDITNGEYSGAGNTVR